MEASDIKTDGNPITTIREVGQHEGQTVIIRGWLYNLRESGKLLFPQFRDGSGIIQGVVVKSQVSPELFDSHQEPDAGIERHRHRQSARRQACPRRLRARRHRRAGGAEGEGGRSLPDFAEGARRRLPDGASSPVAALAAAGGGAAGSRRDHQGGARLLRRSRLHPDRSAHPDARRPAKARRRCSRSTTSRSRRSLRSRASSTSKPRRWRWARCTASGRPSAPRSRRRAAI